MKNVIDFREKKIKKAKYNEADVEQSLKVLSQTSLETEYKDLLEKNIIKSTNESKSIPYARISDGFYTTAEYFIEQYNDKPDQKLLDKSEYFIRKGLSVDNENPNLYYALARIMAYKDREQCLPLLEKAKSLLDSQIIKDENLAFSIYICFVSEYIYNEDYENTIKYIDLIKHDEHSNIELCSEYGSAKENLGFDFEYQHDYASANVMFQDAIKSYNECVELCELELDEMIESSIIDDERQEFLIAALGEITISLSELYIRFGDYVKMERQVNIAKLYGLKKEDFDVLSKMTSIYKKEIAKEKSEMKKQKLSIISKTNKSKLRK